jgi:hypothetical protein
MQKKPVQVSLHWFVTNKKSWYRGENYPAVAGN